MKKVLPLFLALIFAANAAQAQITEGTKLLGGSISAYSQTTDYPFASESKNNSFVFSPSLGFLIKGVYINSNMLHP